MSEKMPSPEEIAKMEKSRTISDAELLKDGAEYILDENGEKMGIDLMEQQRDREWLKADNELYYRHVEKIEQMIESEGIKAGSYVYVKFKSFRDINSPESEPKRLFLVGFPKRTQITLRNSQSKRAHESTRFYSSISSIQSEENFKKKAE